MNLAIDATARFELEYNFVDSHDVRRFSGRACPTFAFGAIPVRQFVLRYVELSPKGTGLCPFHDDQVPSLSVNDKENYWHCFACGVGGSVIDFWMSYQDCDFQTAVSELAEMLLP